MMIAFEFNESTVSEIENGIMNMINEDSSYLELQVKQGKFDRQSELFYRAIEFIKESIGGDDIKNTLKLCVGMSDEEIDETLVGLDNEQDQGMTLS